MKLRDIFEHEIGDSKPKIFWHLPKMDKTDLPFTNGFKSLRNVKRAKQLKNPKGGKVLKKDNTMKKGELCKKKKKSQKA